MQNDLVIQVVYGIEPSIHQIFLCVIKYLYKTHLKLVHQKFKKNRYKINNTQPYLLSKRKKTTNTNGRLRGN